MKRLLAALVFFCSMTQLALACNSQTAGDCTNGNSPAIASVHLGQTNFVQSSVTIRKGCSLLLTDDAATVHNINNGSWVNGAPQPAQEPGAPTVSNLQFSEAHQGKVLGPFTTVGTFHLYCSIHTGMNLTIMVQ